MIQMGIVFLFSCLIISCQQSAQNPNSSKAKSVTSESCNLDTDCYLVNTSTGTGAGCCSNQVDFSQNEWIAVNVKSSKYPQVIQPCYASCVQTNPPLNFQQTAKCINSVCKKVPNTQSTFVSQPQEISTNTPLQTQVNNTVTSTTVLNNPSSSESCNADNQCYLVNTKTKQGPGCCPNQVDFSQVEWIAANVNSSTYPRVPQQMCVVSCARLQVPQSFQQTAKCINSTCQKVPLNQETNTPPSNTVTGTAVSTNQGTDESCNVDTDCYLVNTTTKQGPGCCPGSIDFSQAEWIAVNVNSAKYPKPTPQVCRVACARFQVPLDFRRSAKCVNSICQKVQ